MNKIFRGVVFVFLVVSVLVGINTVIRADEPKIHSISASFINKDKQDADGNVMVGTTLVVEDFLVRVSYGDDKTSVELPKEEYKNLSIDESVIPFDRNRSFTVEISYNEVAKTVDAEKKRTRVTIQTTNESLEKIEATWNGASKYYVGSSIKKGEISLKGTYTTVGRNGNRGEITRSIRNSDFTITPEAIYADKLNNITVNYQDKTTTVQILGYGMSGIDVSYSGNKTVVVGGTVETKKIRANLIYTNGDRVSIKNSDLIIRGETISLVGENIVTVEYEGLIANFSITGIEKKPEKISVKYIGTDLVVGSTIDISKFSVEVTNNDKTKFFTNSDFTISPNVVKEVGLNKITVSYKGLTDVVNIKATEIEPTSIIAIYEGESVIEGSPIDRSSINVTAYYPDGRSINVTDFSTSIETLNTVGIAEVVVEYKKLTANIYIPVTAKTVVDLTVVYNGGTPVERSSLNREKIVVTATYNDGSTSNITDYTINSTTVTKAGENSFTVVYGGRTATLKVEAVARIVLGMGSLSEEATMDGYTTNITAYIQDQFIRDGMELLVENLEESQIRQAINRINNTDKYIAFEMDVDGFQFDENKYMVVELSIPEEFDPAKTVVYYTPDRKRIMVQEAGGLVSKSLYRFYLYKSGTYVLMEKDENDLKVQEIREDVNIAPFLVVSIPRKLQRGTKAKIRPYVLFLSDGEEEYSYEVDDEDILVVSKDGEITPKAEGVANITVTAKKSGLSETYEVEVIK